MFLVSLNTPTGRVYLKRTVFTMSDSPERAQQFHSIEAAQAQLDKAKPFMRAWAYKNATIIPA